MFPDDPSAEAWFAMKRWGDTPVCPHCASKNVQSGAKHPSMPYSCRSCRKRFSVRIGTVMQDSILGYQVWALAIYIMTTSIKGVSSMKLHRDLSIGSYMAECHAFSQELLFVLWWCRQDGFRQFFIIGSRFSRKTCNYFENLSKWVLSHITHI